MFVKRLYHCSVPHATEKQFSQFLITHNSTLKMASVRKTTIGTSAYNVRGKNDEPCTITLTELLKYKMSYCLEMQQINGCDFSISYI
jgi:hypothetical protein